MPFIFLITYFANLPNVLEFFTNQIVYIPFSFIILPDIVIISKNFIYNYSFIYSFTNIHY